MRSKLNLIVVCIPVVLCAFSVGDLEAGKKYSERSMEVMTAVEEEISLRTDGHVMVAGRDSGTQFYEDTSHPLHMNKKTCFGMGIREPEGEDEQYSGTCQMVDGDGDIAWAWWEGDSRSGGTWGWARGTGKYKGIKGQGTWKRPPAVEFPDGGFVIEIDGETELQ